jgi:hypothetical protein
MSPVVARFDRSRSGVGGERACAIEKIGDEKAAQEVRIQILSYAAMLDIWMEQIRLSQGLTAINDCCDGAFFQQT